MKRKTIAAVAAFLLVLAAMALTGCMAGVTKEQRLEMFKEDALTGRNLRRHFSGSNADDVDSDTFSSIFDTGYSLSFDSGNNIVGTTFSFDWYTSTSGNETATGEFTVETDGVSETWYIYRIDPGDTFDYIPTYP